MPVYMLRGIDPELWRRVKSRAALEGKPLREVWIALLEAYVNQPDPCRKEEK